MAKFLWVVEPKGAETIKRSHKNSSGFSRFSDFGVGSGSEGEDRRRDEDTGSRRQVTE